MNKYAEALQMMLWIDPRRSGRTVGTAKQVASMQEANEHNRVAVIVASVEQGKHIFLPALREAGGDLARVVLLTPHMDLTESLRGLAMPIVWEHEGFRVYMQNLLTQTEHDMRKARNESTATYS